MKKRIIALLALVAMMATMLTIPVGAQMYVNDTFDTPPTSGNLTDVSGWTPYSGSMAGTHVFDNGAVKFTPPTGARLFWQRSYSISSTSLNHIVMIDAKFSGNHNINWQFFDRESGGTRMFQQSVNTSKTDTWITFMIIVTDEGKQGDMYWKERDASGDEWNKVTNTRAPLTSRTGTGFRLCFDGYTLAGNMWIDNFRVFNGENAVLKGFKLDTADVDAVADVTAAGTLKAELYTYSDNVVFDTNGVVQDDKTYKTIMVAFDKDGKMLDCNPVNKTIKGGVTSITTELVIDATDAAAIADNGYIATYIWDGMQPVGELIKLGTSPISSTHSDN